jgi:GNAT superfamily N-acetyltransferase
MDQTIFPYQIRWIQKQEWEAAIKLVWRTFLKYEGNDYTMEGIRSFYNFITDGKLYDSLLKGEYQMMVALDEGRVIGVASVRSGNHLSLLFVDEAYHKKGVGRALIKQLCMYLKDEAGERYISLKAAPYAVNFYRKLGFRTVVPEEEYSGIRVTCMEKFF